jgi:molecular chaperone GrpE
MKHKEHKHDSDKENNGVQTADLAQESAAAAPEATVAQESAKSETPPVQPEAKQPLQKEPLKKEIDDRLLRLQADFENFRKRVLKEKTELYQRANEDLFLELLPVLDHLDMALRSAASHNAPPGITDGFKLVYEQLLSTVGKFGLAPFDAEGLTFDPREHFAVSHLPSDAVPENVVINQTRRGFKLGGRLFRAAEVVVSSGKQQAEAPAAVTAEE